MQLLHFGFGQRADISGATKGIANYVTDRAVAACSRLDDEFTATFSGMTIA